MTPFSVDPPPTPPSPGPADRSQVSRRVIAVAGSVAALVVVVALVGSFVHHDPGSSDVTPTTAARAGGGGSASAGGGAVQGTCPAVTEQAILPPRECTVIAPPGHRSTDHLPLVLVLHGFNVEPSALIAAGNWPAAVVRHRFVAVFPHGDFTAWNAGGCCGIPQSTQIDDVAYLQKVIDMARAQLGIDPTRIYMVGVSNGGMMTYRYLCDHADELAGAASVVGTSVAGCSPNHAVPFLHIAARADQTVPYDGGQSLIARVLNVTFPPVEQSLATFATSSPEDCAADPSATTDGALTTRTWNGCAAGSRVRLISVAGADHGWPMGKPIDSTETVLAFFGL